MTKPNPLLLNQYQGVTQTPCIGANGICNRHLLEYLALAVLPLPSSVV